MDYNRRRDLLTRLTPGGGEVPIGELVDTRRDGRIKMFVIQRALAARAGHRAAFERGTYIPLAAAGGRRESVFAFARMAEGDALITCVPRLPASLVPDASTPPLGVAVWADTAIELPAALASSAFVDVFTGTRVEPVPTGRGPALAAATVFDRFPVALLACSI